MNRTSLSLLSLLVISIFLLGCSDSSVFKDSRDILGKATGDPCQVEIPIGPVGSGSCVGEDYNIGFGTENSDGSCDVTSITGPYRRCGFASSICKNCDSSCNEVNRADGYDCSMGGSPRACQNGTCVDVDCITDQDCYINECTAYACIFNDCHNDGEPYNGFSCTKWDGNPGTCKDGICA
ncbi:hypothetical protein H6503_00110 [Candidatus Woesearchaeota archaeon]|nr:hypothetical protein [Candidatus Woesearchaeota archaeon]